MNKYQTIPINEISIPSYYLKAEDNEKQKRLKVIITNRGQTSVLHVRQLDDDSYELIAGRKIFKCLNDLNCDTAVCYNHGKVSLEEAKRICLELGLQDYETDTVELAQMIEDVSKVYSPHDLTKTIPLSVGEIAIYQSYLTYDWEGLWNSYKHAQYERKKKQEQKKKQENLKGKSTPSQLAEIQIQRLHKGIFNVEFFN